MEPRAGCYARTRTRVTTARRPSPAARQAARSSRSWERISCDWSRSRGWCGRASSGSTHGGQLTTSASSSDVPHETPTLHMHAEGGDFLRSEVYAPAGGRVGGSFEHAWHSWRPRVVARCACALGLTRSGELKARVGRGCGAQRVRARRSPCRTWICAGQDSRIEVCEQGVNCMVSIFPRPRAMPRG